MKIFSSRFNVAVMMAIFCGVASLAGEAMAASACPSHCPPAKRIHDVTRGCEDGSKLINVSGRSSPVLCCCPDVASLGGSDNPFGI